MKCLLAILFKLPKSTTADASWELVKKLEAFAWMKAIHWLTQFFRQDEINAYAPTIYAREAFKQFKGFVIWKSSVDWKYLQKLLKSTTTDTTNFV